MCITIIGRYYRVIQFSRVGTLNMNGFSVEIMHVQVRAGVRTGHTTWTERIVRHINGIGNFLHVFRPKDKW